MELNRRVVLARRPVGRPRLDDMRLESVSVPEPRQGELLLEADWLSIDPYMRWRMNDEPSYAPPVPLGDPMPGRTISRVVRSRHADFAEGERVMANCGWQTHAVSDGRDLRRLDPAMPHPTLALGVLGSSGFAAWVGLLRIGQAQAGQTVAVSAATGPVGATVVQLARLHGLRVIAIAGGEAKTAYARETLGADNAIDYRAIDVATQLAAAAPEGIDLYFDNVGGDVLMSVLPHLKVGARVPVCGLAAWYNLDGGPNGPDRSPLLMRGILTRRLRMQGFLLADWAAELPTFLAQMQAWLRDGRVHWREHVVDGIDQAPQALIDMLEGRHLGKTVVKLGALGMRVAVTGARGFLGRRLGRALEADAAIARILAIDQAAPIAAVAASSRRDDFHGDFATPAALAALRAFRPQAVVHTAAATTGVAEEDFDLGLRVNLDGTRALLDACRAMPEAPRVILASTIAVYGPQGGDTPLDERSGLAADSSYGIQKIIAEQLVNDYSRRGWIQGRSLRLPSIMVRDHRPATARSGFLSDMIDLPLRGRDYCVPLRPDVLVALAAVRTATAWLLHAITDPHAAALYPCQLQMPAITTTLGELAACVERVGRRHGRPVGAITWKPDPELEAVVRGWAAHLDAGRAVALGYRADASMDAIVEMALLEQAVSG